MQQQKLKKQVEVDRDTLLQHLQQKLAQLRQQRNHYQTAGYSQNIIQQNINTKILIPPQNKQHISDHLRQKFQQPKAKQKLKQLQAIYNKKKQLQKIGILQNNLTKIQKLYGNPKIQSQLKSYDPKVKQIKQIKNQVLQQQMKKIQKLINKKKATKKQLKQLQQMNFKKLTGNMPEKQSEISRYHDLLKKSLLTNNKLSMVQKQELIQIAFSFIKEGLDTASKQKVKQFLLANQDFCKVFYVSNQQIYRDLQVYETKQQGFLDQRQLYQFLKSNQISNPMLKPSLKYKPKQIKKSSISQNQQKTQSKNVLKNDQQHKKEMHKYMKKVFEYFDAKKQKIIERQKFQIALKKCLLFDIKVYKFIKKQKVISFSQYLKKSRQIKNKKSYYMQLQGKYIGWQQIQQIYQNFQKNIPVIAIDQNTDSELQSEKSQNQITQQPQEKQIVYIPEKIEKGNLQQYFRQYGWSKQQSNNNKDNLNQNVSELNQLKRLDKQYKQLRNKHGNQIQWEGFAPQYKEDFGKLEAYIKSCQQKMKKHI